MADAEGPQCELSPDRETLTVVFPSTPPVGLQLTASRVDEMIVMLGKLRAAMVDQLPMDLPHVHQSEGIIDPRWYVANDMLTGEPLVKVRHPGLGWQTFQIPRDE